MVDNRSKTTGSSRKLGAVALLLFSSMISNAWAQQNYTVVGEDLSRFKADFNAAVDQVRLVFIVGPT